MNYKINFTIPQGPTGPTGPSGSGTGIVAYGGRYNTASGTLSLAIATQTQVPLPSTMPNLNSTYTTNNSININQGGTYEINYNIVMSAAIATTVTVSIRNNGNVIPSATISRPLSVATNSLYSGSTIVNLNANSVIDMAISTLAAVTLTLGTGVSASLSVKKIG